MPPPVSQAIPTVPGGPSAARSEFARAISMRPSTDHIMSVGWIFIPLLGIVAGFTSFYLDFVNPLGGLSLDSGFTFLDVILVIIFYYFLISRRNKHFGRDRIQWNALVGYVAQAAASSGRATDFSIELSAMNSINADAAANEDKKSAALWIILTFVTLGLLGLYVLYFLTKDPYRHDQRQRNFMQSFQSAMSKLGRNLTIPPTKGLPSRSYLIYFILSIVTLGLFEFYWDYCLIKDFNNHFTAQWQLEDNISAIL
jgi:Domain of unknown function (DUF4234)